MSKLVWAYKPLKALGNQTGYVSCDIELADKLLKSGDVQNPQDGANFLSQITYEAEEESTVKEYSTKEIKAKK